MAIQQIKIAQQQQADKPIYLLATGVIECGKFKYSGRHKKDFKSFFLRISDLVGDRFEGVDCDVSTYRYWNAINMYDDFIVANWLESISAEQVEKFANETEVFVITERIRAEFKRAVELKWRRIFRKLDPNDPNIPQQAWQIL
jgi:hypothetical protein